MEKSIFISFSLFFDEDREIIKKNFRKELVDIWYKKDSYSEKGGIIYEGSSGYHTVLMNGAEIWCSCAGFQFRGKCKHIEWAVEDFDKLRKMVGGGNGV